MSAALFIAHHDRLRSRRQLVHGIVFIASFRAGSYILFELARIPFSCSLPIGGIESAGAVGTGFAEHVRTAGYFV